MDQVQQRLDEIKRKQLEMLENSRATSSNDSSKDKSHLVTALMGIAAGITIAAIAWFAYALVTTKDIDIRTWDIRTAILGKLNSKTDEQIEQLNDRETGLHPLEANRGLGQVEGCCLVHQSTQDLHPTGLHAREHRGGVLRDLVVRCADTRDADLLDHPDPE